MVYSLRILRPSFGAKDFRMASSLEILRPSAYSKISQVASFLKITRLSAAVRILKCDLPLICDYRHF